MFIPDPGSKIKKIPDPDGKHPVAWLLNMPFCDQVRILWPVEKCRLLGEEVVIIDSPGIDVEADLGLLPSNFQ